MTREEKAKKRAKLNFIKLVTKYSLRGIKNKFQHKKEAVYFYKYNNLLILYIYIYQRTDKSLITVRIFSSQFM